MNDPQRAYAETFDVLCGPAVVPQKYFHGGGPGLRLGDRILPPSQTGALSLLAVARKHAAEIGKPFAHMRDDRVYLGGEIAIAILFAAMYPLPAGGWIYEVDPEEPIEPDPDYAGEGSYQAPAGMIVRVWGALPTNVVASVRRDMAR